MPSYGYLVVEGPHYVEFVYRLLSPFGLKRVRLERDLDRAFHALIPRNYPPEGDLLKRMPIPLFLQSPSHLIAVHSAVGDTRMVETVEENMSLIDQTQVDIGVILDSDKQVPAEQRYADIRALMAPRGFVLDAVPGGVTRTRPRLGAFVLPDNQSSGTLEDLLLDAAPQVYPGILASAWPGTAFRFQNNLLSCFQHRKVACRGTLSLW